MIDIRVFAALALLAPLVMAAAPSAGAQGLDERVRSIQRSLSPDRLRMLDVHAGAGSVRLIGADRDDIEVIVRLSFPGGGVVSRPPLAEAFSAAGLGVEVREGTLHLQIDYAAEVAPGEIMEHWKLLVPRRLAAEIEMTAGDLRVIDLQGGVDAQLGFGDIEISVPGGPVQAAVSTGNVTVLSSSDHLGSVSISSLTGQTSLFLDGRKVRSAPARGPASRVDWHGKGHDRVVLHAQMGNISMRAPEQRIGL